MKANAMNIAPTFSLRKLPPATAHGVLEAEPAFGNRGRRPVSAELEGDGEFRSPGISFEDYKFMNTMQRKTSGERRLPTPTWATNTSEFRILLTRFLELRAGIREPGAGSLAQRLNAAQQKMLQSIPRKVAVIDRLSREYVELKKTGTDPERALLLEREVRNLDTVIRMIRMGPGGVARMVQIYYGCGCDSVDVGSEIGISPTQVRQTLFRLHKTAKELANPKPPKPRKPKPEPGPRYCRCGAELPKRLRLCDACGQLRRQLRKKLRYCQCGALLLERWKRSCDNCKHLKRTSSGPRGLVATMFGKRVRELSREERRLYQREVARRERAEKKGEAS